MSFAPNPRYGTGLSPVVRTVLFWLLMMVLAVVLWRMSSTSNNSQPSHQMSYSDFLQDVDNNKVATANFRLAQNTADVSGKLREPSQEFRTTVPRDNASSLMERLRTAGASVEVSEATRPDLVNWLINLLPLLLLVVLWIFIMKRSGGKRSSQQNPTNIPPSNTPL